MFEPGIGQGQQIAIIGASLLRRLKNGPGRQMGGSVSPLNAVDTCEKHKTFQFRLFNKCSFSIVVHYDSMASVKLHLYQT